MIPPGEITLLLQRAQTGDKAAHELLLTTVYEELKRISRSQRRRAPDDTFGTTALVHEAYLRLVGNEQAAWPDRHRFFAYAARAMRTILIDRARHNLAEKRGADLERVPLDDAHGVASPASVVDLLALHDVLEKIAKMDPRAADVIELHVFGGLPFDTIAQCLQIGERTVYRAWQKGRALIQALVQDVDQPPRS